MRLKRKSVNAGCLPSLYELILLSNQTGWISARDWRMHGLSNISMNDQDTINIRFRNLAGALERLKIPHRIRISEENRFEVLVGIPAIKLDEYT